MNNIKRKKIKQSIILLNQAENIINDVLLEEEGSFDNLSEGLQQTLRGEQMEENIETLEETLELINESLELLSNIE